MAARRIRMLSPPPTRPSRYLDGSFLGTAMARVSRAARTFHSGPLPLRPDELIQPGDAVAVGNRDVPMVRLRPTDVELVAVLAEQSADVGGEVAEEVARIGVI